MILRSLRPRTGRVSKGALLLAAALGAGTFLFLFLDGFESSNEARRAVWVGAVVFLVTLAAVQMMRHLSGRGDKPPDEADDEG